jgi:hypothetical protein
MKKVYIFTASILAAVILVQACSKFEPAAAADDELLDNRAGLT